MTKQTRNSDELNFLFTFDDEHEETQIDNDNASAIKQDRKRRAEDSIKNIMAENPVSSKKSKVKIPFKNPLDNVILKKLPSSGCVHEIACPKNIKFKPLNPLLLEPACEFNFKLDPFQSKAIQCIENSQSVLVSAHTSAGKTVCAQYAISMCLRENRRVIYTTPIKALSNQKYREFKEQYTNVGLMTGDVTIDENANVLIMTTEILRSMIYKNSSVLKEVGWLVFDEIHYMGNKSRGYVWEEVLIQLPREHRMIFLSATIPNGPLFAKWIAYTHKKPCHIVYTEYRPTPLRHYIFPNTGDTIYQIVDNKNKIIEANLENAIEVLLKEGENAKADTRNVGRKGGLKMISSHIETLVQKMKKLKKFPMIIFSFSKNDCDGYAKLLKKLDFNDNSEKRKINIIYTCAVKTLPIEHGQASADDNLPELSELLVLMRKGIGIHHGGMLPVAKEITEILFQEGLIKVLLATDTFAMGLNMPAKTVIFSSPTKFDGEIRRVLTGAEYTQMAGRAGRRGIDETGECVMVLDKPLHNNILRGLLSGVSEPLNSAFKLTFGTILSLARGNNANLKPEDLIRKSFLQFQAYGDLPVLRSKLETIKSSLQDSDVNLSFTDMNELKVLAEKEDYLRTLREEKWNQIRHKERFRPFLKRGRLVHVKRDDLDFGWCIVISDAIRPKGKDHYKLDVLVKVTKKSALADNEYIDQMQPITDDNRTEEWKQEYEFSGDGVLAVADLMDVLEISTRIDKSIGKRIAQIKCDDGVRRNCLKEIDEVIRKERPALLDFKKDFRLTKKQIGDYYDKTGKIEKSILHHPLMNKLMKIFESPVPCTDLVKEAYIKYNTLSMEASKLENRIEYIQNAVSMDQVHSRILLLKKMGHLTENSVVTLKGLVACELANSGCNNIRCPLGLEVVLLSELLMSGIFTHMKPDKVSGILTVLILDEAPNKKGEISVPLGADLVEPFKSIKSIVNKLLECAKESRLISNVSDSPLNKLDTRMVEAVRAWSTGSKFRNLMRATGFMEGAVVRCIRRVHELLIGLKSAAVAMDNRELQKLFQLSAHSICRGIIFSNSLYTVDPSNEEM